MREILSGLAQVKYGAPLVDLLRAELRPGIHQPTALVEQIPPAVSRFDLVVDRVCDRHLDNFIREVGALSRPIAERRTEAVGRDLGVILLRIDITSLPALRSIAVHAANQIQHGHVREGFAILETREDKLSTLPAHALQHGKGWRGERHAVFPVPLHALARNSPQAAVGVDFRLARPDHLVGPTGRPEEKLERRRRDTHSRLQILHEIADLVIGQRRMMLDLADLGFRRQ
jgi:hypothetical protein